MREGESIHKKSERAKKGHSKKKDTPPFSLFHSPNHVGSFTEPLVCREKHLAANLLKTMANTRKQITLTARKGGERRKEDEEERKNKNWILLINKKKAECALSIPTYATVKPGSQPRIVDC